ncbi:hypothetical protein KSK55_04455 [Methanospirillum purgamenti]|uniref:Uncharacterized protein n=1 Tax=Methanospirillum hungatei TaxID=2203 RepID=A0A8F5ZI65_METHU|nr:hypothetical protein [Methanospirillum hungatei]QXO95653.1 hypothetical protein KSK55_04455 [Methanospirillum hungatei]
MNPQYINPAIASGILPISIRLQALLNQISSSFGITYNARSYNRRASS